LKDKECSSPPKKFEDASIVGLLSVITIINRFESCLSQKHPIITQRKCKVILLHDNARLHVAKIVKDTLSAL